MEENTFPDIGSMIDQELKDAIARLADEEGDELITGDDVQKLTDILLGKVPDADEAR